jgi:outer membrane autotransporter protein
LNWWHGPGAHSITMSGLGNSVNVNDGLPANRAEAKVGLEASISNNLSVWGWGATQIGKGYHNSLINLGVKYSW